MPDEKPESSSRVSSGATVTTGEGFRVFIPRGLSFRVELAEEMERRLRQIEPTESTGKLRDRGTGNDRT